MQTHNDQIWCSDAKEIGIVKEFNQFFIEQGFTANPAKPYKNFGYPQIYTRKNQIINCRFVDSVFFDEPESWTSGTVITDNIPRASIGDRLILAVPEFWHIWHFEPVFIDRAPTRAYNCFMNRVSGDRSIVFYELIRRCILDQGIVSYNCTSEELEQQFINADLQQYQEIHNVGRELLPYNTVQTHGKL
jgi:hypothetical protein